MKSILLGKPLRSSVLLLFAIVLAGCGPIAFSPEQIAVREALESLPQNGVTDPDSVEVLQSLEFNGLTFLLVSFRQQVENLQQDCMFVYVVRRSPIGTWAPTSGGGGCSGQIGGGEHEEMPPISQVGINTSSGDGGALDPGYTSIRGLVHADEILKVRVIWLDNIVQEVNVINHSFLIARAGQLDMINIEGLNKDGEVVYDHKNPPAAPGK